MFKHNNLNNSPLSVNGAQVCVLEQANNISLCGLLQCTDSATLVTKVGLKLLRDFLYLKREFYDEDYHGGYNYNAHQSLKWSMLDQQLCCLLVATDFFQGDRARSISANFPCFALYSSIPSDLRQMLPLGLQSFCLGVQDFVYFRDLSTRGFACCLFRAYHDD